MLSVLILMSHLLLAPSLPADAAARTPALSTAVRGYASGLEGTPRTLPSLSPVSPLDADASLTPEEDDLLRLVNQDRAASNLAPLTPDARLTALARTHSRDMALRGYFDHAAPGPGPSTPMERFLAALGRRPEYAMVGENIYYRSLTDDAFHTSDQAEAAFMNSPGHRANILQPHYSSIGIGFWRDPATGAFWVTQMFCTLSGDGK